MSNPNKLINEQSPYLLQHAYNPVHWYPWNDEVFEKARKENKPIFLSIGYSTCHWCHVMEKESFEDEEVAKLMNDTFISVKVDREERPDVDGVYMTVCQMLTGGGGWPMTIVMTPDKKPFFAGTYFPKNSHYGRVGMLELLPKLAELWKSKREDILKSAEEISAALNKSAEFPDDEVLSPEILNQALSDLSNRFDSINGGFGNSPKFPTPHTLTFLLRCWKKSGNENTLKMVEKTLQKMRLGGIYDHIGFGFHRYSTDVNWLVPHFEKMLYDQALLAIAYIETYQVTKNDFYKETAKEILEYVSRDMKSPEGAFYSAEDADSEGEEGKFYLWTVDEVRKILKKDAELFIDYFNVVADGNWVDLMHGGKTGTNILHVSKLKTEICRKYLLSLNELEVKLNSTRKRLLEYREKRICPFKDDKVLTDWNSLMISAYAKAAQVFDEKEYIEIAESAGKFILKHMILPNGRLLHRYRNGNADIPGNLDDYAFFISAWIDLYETTFDVHYLDKALYLQNDQIKYFWDDVHDGFFFTASDSEELLIRQKEIYDGAIPSGNSISLLNLVQLFRLSGNPKYEEISTGIIKTFSKTIKSSPSAYAQFLSGLDFFFGPSKEILITGNREEEISNYLKILHEQFIPNKVILCKSSRNEAALAKAAEFTNAYTADKNTRVFVCERFECKLPITTKADFQNELNSKD